VASPCDPLGCDKFFRGGFIRRKAGSYRRRGLDPTAARMVGFLEQRGIAGASVLEVGGGVGEIQLELLRRGAARAVNLELSPAYEAEAANLMREAGVEGRVTRRLQDIAVDGDAVEPADVVVLHRVVCCYPDYERLLAAAADHARRLVVFSYPSDSGFARLVVGAENLSFRLRRLRFRVFAHPQAGMLAVLRDRGLQPTVVHRGRAWQVAGAER
jgi:2-polyprenyl-3-methyl-5-hydroxy-6-metoxy-1,4-benzoquinol methylase